MYVYRRSFFTPALFAELDRANSCDFGMPLVVGVDKQYSPIGQQLLISRMHATARYKKTVGRSVTYADEEKKKKVFCFYKDVQNR